MAEQENSNGAREYRGRLLHIETDEIGELKFRPPPRADYHRFVAQVQDDKKDKFLSMVSLVKACAVSPVGQELDDIIEDFPGLVSDISSRLVDLATPTIRASVKKGS